jgi:hypothetical protein
VKYGTLPSYSIAPASGVERFVPDVKSSGATVAVPAGSMTGALTPVVPSRMIAITFVLKT